MSIALAKAIKKYMNIELQKEDRPLIKAYVNLNDLNVPLFSNINLLKKK